MNSGLILVFTGNGKGKTSAALGTILRTLGNGGRVALLQFMKGNIESSEREFFKNVENVDVFTCGAGWFKNKKEKQIQIDKAKEGLNTAKDIFNSNKYNLIVLDEINYILGYKLLSVEEIIKLLDNRNNSDVVLTGRNADKKIIEMADTVSEINEIKHAFQKKIPAKKGIDF